MPEGVILEGAGDCLWDRHRGLFWMGCGFRSDAAASAVVERTFGVGCVALALADPSFYHLDTAFCALPCGGVIYYPGAFTHAGREIIEWLVAPSQRIALAPDDAARFSANAVSFGNVVIMSGASERLAQALAERGYVLVTTPLDAFLKSGGSACCLTLRLDQGLQAAPAHRAAAGPAG
jgi:N-dimethylarginine dimethylaminohydrolase